MANIDAILADFNPERFQRKNLRKCRFFWPGPEYFIRLDAYVGWLISKIRMLQEELAKNGNHYYQRDAAKWGEKYRQAQMELAEKDAEIEGLKRKNKNLEKENEYLQNLLEEQGDRGKHQSRDKKGRFVSNIPKKEKMRRADDLKRKGFSTAQIARSLGVSPETVKNYLRLIEEERDAHWEELERNWKAAE